MGFYSDNVIFTDGDPYISRSRIYIFQPRIYSAIYRSLKLLTNYIKNSLGLLTNSEERIIPY